MGFIMFVHCGCEEPEIVKISDWNGFGDPPRLLFPPLDDAASYARGTVGAYCWLSRKIPLSFGNVKENMWWWAAATDDNISEHKHKYTVELVYERVGEAGDDDRHYKLIIDNRENVEL